MEIREWILSWEQFSPLVRQQVLTMIVMYVCGMTIGALRTVDLLTLKRWTKGVVTAWILEVLFWILAGLWAAECLYYCARGALSFHGIVALILGFYSWKRVFCREIVRFAETVICRQEPTRWGIIKRSVNSGETIGEHRYGKDETKPFVQKRTGKQRHRHR